MATAVQFIKAGAYMRIFTDFIFLLLFFVFLAVWAVGWLAFHAVAGGIHLLLLLAVIFLVIHLFRGGARRPG
jgi:hypothetical protein